LRSFTHQRRNRHLHEADHVGSWSDYMAPFLAITASAVTEN
jgi:hypothetical protein